MYSNAAEALAAAGSHLLAPTPMAVHVHSGGDEAGDSADDGADNDESEESEEDEEDEEDGAPFAAGPLANASRKFSRVYSSAAEALAAAAR